MYVRSDGCPSILDTKWVVILMHMEVLWGVTGVQEHRRRGKLTSKFPYDPVLWGYPERQSGVCRGLIGVSLKSIQNQEVILFSFLYSETEDSSGQLNILSTVAVSEQPQESQGLPSTDAWRRSRCWMASMPSICLLGTIQQTEDGLLGSGHTGDLLCPSHSLCKESLECYQFFHPFSQPDRMLLSWLFLIVLTVLRPTVTVPWKHTCKWQLPY